MGKVTFLSTHAWTLQFDNKKYLYFYHQWKQVFIIIKHIVCNNLIE